ncbi:MAG: hypothetical protein IJ092_13500 [Atopobiaceae bacterium]|nr:hypothetical protein [Atopobiaceae bacterium]
MDIIIAGSDAIRTYRIARQIDAPLRVEPTTEEPSDFSYGTSARFRSTVLSPLETLGIMAPECTVHLRFPSLEARKRLVRTHCHVCRATLPKGSCWRIVPESRALAKELLANGVRLFVDSPQLCVVHAAAQAQKSCSPGSLTKRIVPMARSIALASELAGTFSLDPTDPRKSRPTYNIESLLGESDLRDFLERVRGADGLKAARIAGETIVGGQGSPAEVALYAGMVLRPKLGGFHLEKPTANRALDPNSQLRELLKHDRITPDFYWERYGLVIEYDGGDHFSVAGAREDRRRVFDYQNLQLVVLPALAEDMRSVDAFDSFIRSVERVMERTDGLKLRRRINKIIADKEARLCRSLLLSGIQTAG